MTYARNRFRVLPILLAFFLVVAGCDSNDNGDDGGNGNPFGSGTMSANIGGDSFDAVIVVGIFQNGILSVTGNLGASQGGSQQQLSITIPNASETTFQVSPVSGVSAVYAAGDLTGADGWVGLSGTIDIEELTTEGASGSFSFTAQNNAQQQIQVTNGQFSTSFSN